MPIGRRYGVHDFPTILFLDPSGKVQGRLGGYLPPDQFAAELTRISSARRDLPILEAQYRKNPSDGDTAAKLAVIYAGREDAARAESYLARAVKTTGRRKSAGLAKAYNAVGDVYQLGMQFEKAIPYFRKGAEYATHPDDLTYSRMSVAACLFSEKRYKEAIPDLQATLALPGAPAEMKRMAEQMLKTAEKKREK